MNQYGAEKTNIKTQHQDKSYTKTHDLIRSYHEINSCLILHKFPVWAIED